MMLVNLLVSSDDSKFTATDDEVEKKTMNED